MNSIGVAELSHPLCLFLYLNCSLNVERLVSETEGETVCLCTGLMMDSLKLCSNPVFVLYMFVNTFSFCIK